MILLASTAPAVRRPRPYIRNLFQNHLRNGQGPGIRMAETHSQRVQYRDYGRLPRYWAFGLMLLVALAVGSALVFFGVRSPGVLELGAAFWVLGFAIVVLALGLFYLLFTLRGTMRLVRDQATEVAILRSRLHTHPAHFAQPQPGFQQAPSRSVEIVEGIGPVMGQRLSRAGIETLRDLRAASAGQVADAAQTSPAVAERWKVMADLMVLHEVDAQAAELLERSGVQSVEELASQDPDALHQKVRRVNTAGESRIVPRTIAKEEAATWVEAAKRFGQGNGPVPRAGTVGPGTTMTGPARELRPGEYSSVPTPR